MSDERPDAPGSLDMTELGQLLDAALDLEPGERLAWLEALRRANPAAAGQVAALLERESELAARGFLDRSVSLEGLAIPTLAGQEIGPYTLLRPLGRGGMGGVWLARRSDGRYEGEVAIKLLNLSLLDPVGRERFRREGNTLARVTHPNIAHLIDAGVTPLGHPYLVLERVDGERIDEYCERRRLAPDDRLRLVRQVLSAVAHAHASLVVHRDIKPSNILVTADGVVKLLDFGIAKLLAAETGAAERTELTEAGGTLLTPEYAAPEQVTGAPVTAATDVYSLGILLYVLLAGVHPTARDGRTGPDLLRDLLEREPARLGGSITAETAALRSISLPRLRKLYAGDLGTIVLRALEKDPGRRYATAAELRDDLDRYLAHQPILARPAGRMYRLAKFVRRNRLPVSIGGLAAVALLVATAVASLQMLEARRQRDAAEVQRDRAVYQSRRAAAASGFMLSLVSGLHPDEKASPIELVERARAILERDQATDPAFISRMLLELADEFATAVSIPTMRGMLERSVELAGEAGDPDLVAQAHCTLAGFRLRTYVQADSGRRDLERGYAALRDRPAGDALAWARCLLAEMRLRWLEEARDSASALADLALARGAAAMDTTTPAYGQLLGRIAEQHFYLGRFRSAHDLAKHAGSIFRRSGRGESAQALEALALEFSALEAFDPLASDSTYRVWQDLTRRLGRTSTEVLENRTAHHVMSLGRPDSAVALWSAALARQAPGSVRYANMLNWLIRAEIESGRLPEARRHVEELRGLPDPPRLDLLMVEGRLAEATGDTRLALERYAELLDTEGYPELRRAVSFWPYVARAGRMAFRSGAFDRADSLTSAAYAYSLRFRPDDRLSAGRIRLVQGRIRAALGDTSGALRMAGEAITALASRSGSPALVPGELEAAQAFLEELRGASGSDRIRSPNAAASRLEATR